MRAINRSRSVQVLITAGVVALYFICGKVPLPFIVLKTSTTAHFASRVNIMTLGFAPLTLGYVTVEFAAFLVPQWRWLRAGSQTGRAKLHRASLILGLFIAMGQTVFLILAFRNGGASLVSAVAAGVVLVGATAALVVLAQFTNNDGLGSGFTCLVLAAGILTISAPIKNVLIAVQIGKIPLSSFLGETLVLGLVGLLVVLLSSELCLPETASDVLRIGRPASGLAPITVIPAALAMLPALTGIGKPNANPWNSPDGKLFWSCLLSVFVFAYLFNLPKRIARVWDALSPNPLEGLPRLKPAMVESALFIASAVGLQSFLIGWLKRFYVPDLVAVILVTAAVCDLAQEWLARGGAANLTIAWEIHQPYAVAPAMRLLEAQGFHPFARGLHVRCLLQFFGPYVPIQILVPLDEAQACRSLLEERWPK
jgi:hypothetical protein